MSERLWPIVAGESGASSSAVSLSPPCSPLVPPSRPGRESAVPPVPEGFSCIPGVRLADLAAPLVPPRPRRRGPAGHGPPRRAFLLGEGETARVIDATAGERFALRDRALLELLYGSAVRCSEARRLRVEDLDLAAGTATVLGKGKRVRRVFLSAAAVAALRAHLAAAGIAAGWVFHNRDGRRVSRRLIARVVEKYAAKAGTAHVSPHSLRHSAASHMLARGAYLFAVKEVLGHVRVETTARYLHFIDPGESAEAIYRRAHPRG